MLPRRRYNFMPPWTLVEGATIATVTPLWRHSFCRRGCHFPKLCCRRVLLLKFSNCKLCWFVLKEMDKPTCVSMDSDCAPPQNVEFLSSTLVKLYLARAPLQRAVLCANRVDGSVWRGWLIAGRRETCKRSLIPRLC